MSRDLSTFDLSDFAFEVPEDLIAQNALSERDHARLLIREIDGRLLHKTVHDLLSEVKPGSLIVWNETKVFPSRLHARLPTGGLVEVFLLTNPQQNSNSSSLHLALARPLKKLSAELRLDFGEGLTAAVHSRATTSEAGVEGVYLQFNLNDVELKKWLDLHAVIPLPPYIKRTPTEQSAGSDVRKSDQERYQTVYAEVSGSVAAPTAGLHFTAALISGLKERGVLFAPVCLHVGGGTFLPVKHQTISDHPMHRELFLVPRTTLDAIELAQSEGRGIVAVGTTSLRSLEGLFSIAESRREKLSLLCDQWLSTDLFIYPRNESDRFKPWCATALMTNFHQPESTLFMLISALIGLENAKAMYQMAIAHRYRFFSYGDSSLLKLS